MSMEIPIRRLVLNVVLIMIITLFLSSSSSSEKPLRNCSSSCGHIRNITFPFRLTTDPQNCGHQLYTYYYELSCDNNITTIRVDLRSYYVKAINYDNHTIRVASADVQQDNCSSIPSMADDFINPFETEIRFKNRSVQQISERIMFLSCKKPAVSPSYIDTAPCINSSSLFPENKGNNYSYVVYANGFKFSDLKESCQVYRWALVSSPPQGKKNITSYKDIHNELVYGFELSWVDAFAEEDTYRSCPPCYVDETSNQVHCTSCSRSLNCDSWKCILMVAHYYTRFVDTVIMIGYQIEETCDSSWKCLHIPELIAAAYQGTIGLLLEKMQRKFGDAWDSGEMQFAVVLLTILTPRTIAGISFLIGLAIYKWRRRHLSIYKSIEEFLQSHNNLVPIRYSYSEVRKMTKGFKTKLGEGGFGCVFKGKLRSGRFVAIKMLGKSKASGPDFVNEVATIGRIHHINVVRLIGFCVEGSKRALVYDFMPNGSLEKYIFLREGTSCSLSFEKIFDISLGIARGIEYLHRGCDMRILHFDIKPHNILLDENFIPKISDFGLARPCPLDNSIVSLTAARGTYGYMAPELYYRNIGGVSHKADVYSFGMLLMEMANRRKNVHVGEDSSAPYFPIWIYDQFSQGKDLEIIEDAADEELKMIKKMAIVALWCIQLKPCDRPSMREVTEMLETDIELLQMPPKPSLYPQENHNRGNEGETSNTTCSSTPEEDSADVSLISNAN